jgi:hypothetical protein
MQPGGSGIVSRLILQVKLVFATVIVRVPAEAGTYQGEPP